jgi:ATP-dependent DNA helicase UvrD/PcrA
MFVMINVTDDDIAYVESILLGENQTFDDERINFIKNLDTIDLQAVPGSGKTTALLAKLLILEKYMPLKNGRGVLVISHTNAAVDEIKERIGKHCPKLFSYPNFVGTIQSFVDVFLAIPFYINEFKQKPFRIDNEIYDEQVNKFYNNTQNRTLKNYLDRQHDGLSFLKSIRITTTGKLISYLNGTVETFKLKNQETTTYKSLLNFKLRMLKNGYLHFDDAYSLAAFQLGKVPNYPKLLQKRFEYIFVDEMQDMDVYQHDLLEKIFYSEGENESSFQRIGDKNQAIFNGGSIHIDDVWGERENILYLNGSHRLNQNISPLIEKLALIPNTVEGLYKNSDGSNVNIRPIIFTYTNESKTELISTYAAKIKALQETGEIPASPSHKFMAIAWRKEVDGDGKIGLADYWSDYISSVSKNQIDYKVLTDYLLHFDKEKKTLESVRKNILNALLRILRMENVTDEHDRVYTKRNLINFIKELENNEYITLKLYLYKWSIDSIKGESKNTLTSIREYIPTYLLMFDKEINNSASFINDDSELIVTTIETQKLTNIFQSENINIEIGTIHSVKGQTHTATLYLETFYNRGYGNYESERLRNQFLGENINDTLAKNIGGKDKIRQTAKMAYVGFSRSTHLLCIAICKDRFDNVLSEIDRDLWDIIEIGNN